MIYTFIDLFCGAGGMTAGFVKAGLKPVQAVEIEPDAAETYRINHGDHVVVGPIQDVADEDWLPADFVIGGPPCQGFSPLGRMTGNRDNLTLNGLWREFARVVRHSEPKVFVVENVPQFLRSAEYQALRRFTEDLGYEVCAGVLNAADFGVAQKRRRAVVIGSRVGAPQLPLGRSARPATVWDVFRSLPRPKGHGEKLERGAIVSGLDLHFTRNPTPLSLSRYRCVPKGGNRFDLLKDAPHLAPRCWLNKPSGSTDVFGRMRKDEPALTIRTEFFKPEKGRYLHPTQHRAITHLEAALLQSFSLSYKWTGSKLSLARQIGNAVPPLLARAIALSALRTLQAGGARARSYRSRNRARSSKRSNRQTASSRRGAVLHSPLKGHSAH